MNSIKCIRMLYVTAKVSILPSYLQLLQESFLWLIIAYLR